MWKLQNLDPFRNKVAIYFYGSPLTRIDDHLVKTCIKIGGKKKNSNSTFAGHFHWSSTLKS